MTKYIMPNNTDPFISRYATRFQLNMDSDWTNREAKLRILKHFKNGTIYDNLQCFHQEYGGDSGGGNYVKLASRRPSIIYSLPKIIVNQSTSMLFGEGHFPSVRCEEDSVEEFLHNVTRLSNLPAKMLHAAKEGSLGSVCIIIKILKGEYHFDVLETYCLYPIFDQLCPNTLINLVEKRKADGDTLRMQGYVIKDEKNRKRDYYVVREWTNTDEIYYMPYLCEDEQKEDFRLIIDKERSSNHGFGFIPAIWIKNSESNHIDGLCTFEPIIDISIEINYQLSQLGRLLKYNSDPTLVVKNPGGMEGSQLIKSLNMLQLDEKGDAYFVEMTTGPTQAVIEYVRVLREYALEVVRGDRSNPEKLNAVHSGKALQMLNAPLISLVDEMRLTYGEYGLRELYCMILDIYQLEQYDISDIYAPIGNLSSSNYRKDLTLDWPDWYSATPQDKLQNAQTLTTLVQGTIISQNTATTSIADEYNILDIEEEVKEINNMQKELHNMQNNSISKTTSAKNSSSGDNE